MLRSDKKYKVETFFDASKAKIRVRPIDGQGIPIQNVQFPNQYRYAAGLLYEAYLNDTGKFYRATCIRLLNGTGTTPENLAPIGQPIGRMTRLNQLIETKPQEPKAKRRIILED